MRKTDTHVFFWNGIYSQWHKSNFEEDGVIYTSAEKYMMAKKAEVFEDYEIQEKILKSNNPRDIKALGRKIKNFTEEKWNEHKIPIVAQGSYLKFTQNKSLLDEMMEDKDLILVEASPYDRIWGIGLAPDNDDVLDINKWNGQNLLGVCLTLAREQILKEQNEN